MFSAWKKIDQMSAAIKTLWGVVGVLVLLNIFMWAGWKSAPQQLRLYIPPDLSRGAMISPENVPKSTVYAFAYQIFTAINTWTNSGDKDYKANITSYKNYLSTSFYNDLLKDYQSRKDVGALDRTRMMTGVTGMGYTPTNVKKLGDGTWLVNMQLEITEEVGSSDVKKVVMDYPIIVAKVNESIQVNPWGLVIKGFYQEPYRKKTII